MEKFFCREKITKGKPRFSAEREVNWDQKPRIFCMETIGCLVRSIAAWNIVVAAGKRCNQVSSQDCSVECTSCGYLMAVAAGKRNAEAVFVSIEKNHSFRSQNPLKIA